MNIEFRNKLAELLREASQAHHDAFTVTDGEDADWPIWYAAYLLEPLDQQLGMTFAALLQSFQDGDGL